MDIETIKTIVAAIVRHGLTVYGGATIFSPDQAQTISGAVAVLIAVAWSVWQKRKSPVAA